MTALLDRYVRRQIMASGALVALTLAGILLMTQSLRFLELIISSGASGLAFITLSLLALPRFFEVILPLSLATATVFVYIRLRRDGELLVMQGAGMAPHRLARPGFYLSLWVAGALFIIMGWIAPLTLGQMNHLRAVIKDQYSALLFREGVFNSAAGGKMTVYVAQRSGPGGLTGLMLYDARPENPSPVTILAQRGQLIATQTGQQILVEEGQRHMRNPDTGVIERLTFDRYVIDLPEQNPIASRWAEPDERTLVDLWMTPYDGPAGRMARDFLIEQHRRLVAPFLAPCFFVVVMAVLMRLPYRRTASLWDLVVPGAAVIAIQALYFSALSTARTSDAGLILIYVAVFGPLVLAYGVTRLGSGVGARA